MQSLHRGELTTARSSCEGFSRHPLADKKHKRIRGRQKAPISQAKINSYDHSSEKDRQEAYAKINLRSFADLFSVRIYFSFPLIFYICFCRTQGARALFCPRMRRVLRHSRLFPLLRERSLHRCIRPNIFRYR